MALTDLLVGLTIVFFSVAVGPTRVARGLRKRLAPLLEQGAAAAVIGGLLIFFVLLWLKPGGLVSLRVPFSY